MEELADLVKLHYLFYKKQNYSKYLPKGVSVVNEYSDDDSMVFIDGDKVIISMRGLDPTSLRDLQIGINIVDLGLVYDIDVNEENDVQVLMTLTAPNCPFGEMIMMETEFAVRSLKEANLIKITLTFEPPWNPDIHVSDEAKYQMGIL